MFTVHVRSERLQHKLKTLAEKASDLDAPLKMFGAYLRKRALERYKAQSFAPLADSTLKERAARGVRRMETKLHRELRRAVTRSNVGKNPQSVLKKYLESKELDPSVSKGVQNRLAVLQEFQGRHRTEGSIFQHGGFKALSLKQMGSLGERTDRAIKKSIGAPILGGLPRTLVVEVENGTMRLTSRTHEQFSAVHNEGGQAGGGAKIPKRETLLIEEEDLRVLTNILKKHHLLSAFQE